MHPKDLALETYSALAANKARSSLTVLGIVIGIASVIAMISIGQGAQSSIQNSIESIGSNLLMVTPGFSGGFGGGGVSAGRGSATTLTQADAEAIAAQTSAADVAPDVTRSYQITATGTNTRTQVIGTVPAYSTVRNVAVSDGSFITQNQEQEGSRVAVLGPTTRDDLFGQSVDALGKKIRINRIEFTVIGITQSKGGTGFGNQDDRIFVPLSTASRYLSGDKFVSTISVSAKNGQDITALQAEISSLLLNRHHITDATAADFSILNQADIIATASTVTSTFTLLLGAVAGISLVVGGIGIMNMMLTTVTERTREIGLRKALGARRNEISNQFLAEAVALTLLGGIFGVIGGWLMALAVTQFGGITTTVSPIAVLLGCGVSAGIGIVFGWYPARRAARLDPITALRYE